MTAKKILIPVFTITLLIGTLGAVPQAHAQGTTATTVTHPNFFQGLINFIAQKFGLDKTQVQSAINDYHAQQKANVTPRPTLSAQDMQNREKSRLDKLVSQGKITSDQETAIINELTSLQSKYNLQNVSPDQRRTQMQAMQNDLKTWANSQGIDPSYIMMFGMGGPRGRGMKWQGGPHGNWGAKPSPTPTP